jgi:hypothetical protein
MAESSARARWSRPRAACLVLTSLTLPCFACSEDETDGGECGGAVDGTNEAHCEEANGTPIEQAIGACVSGVDEAEAEEGEEHEHEEEEEHEPNFGSEAVDDTCKYRVSFENTCVSVDRPVTFTLSLTRLFDEMPGAGANPAFPEIFLANEPTHISPSNNILAAETSPGTYEIGPILFDRSGRWVVRFHYFDTCSELPVDSPHSHAAFYIDVP